ncbi:hypothetical protein NQ315_015168 [Exocentrus adspersus]|uniref:Uncharacterized protein n=1 Tax=Exocentrus adspersus TaxID=1586481 RepID=A0AAV8VBS9_9CUCU|nr:hypothetical protein NQ315_015168 [Exocentrus adspersus]
MDSTPYHSAFAEKVILKKYKIVIYDCDAHAMLFDSEFRLARDCKQLKQVQQDIEANGARGS